MKKKIHNITRVLEMIISAFIIVAILISMVSLLNGLKVLTLNVFQEDAFRNFLSVAFNIIIGIEFLKMLFKINVYTVIEVLLFAIARQMIVEHTTVYDNFISVASIALLFIIRKYLLNPELDQEKEMG